MAKEVAKETDQHHRNDDVVNINKDDEEISSYLNSKKEIELKRKIWELMNRDYIFHKPPIPKHRNANNNNNKRKKKDESPTMTATDNAPKKRANKSDENIGRLSSKINYDALHRLFGVSGNNAGGGCDQVEAGEEVEKEDDRDGGEQCNVDGGGGDHVEAAEEEEERRYNEVEDRNYVDGGDDDWYENSGSDAGGGGDEDGDGYNNFDDDEDGDGYNDFDGF